MKNKKQLSKLEVRVNKKIQSGEINPVRIPRFRTTTDILKYQLCSEIIKYKKVHNKTQNDIAVVLDVNKSEVSKLFSYQLREFSTDRLLSMIETLIRSGADIQLESIFEEVKKKVTTLDKSIRPRPKSEVLI